MTSSNMPSAFRMCGLSALAMVAFAANSLLARAALRDDLIDPVAFTQIRLAAGALILLPFFLRAVRRSGFSVAWHKDWRPALALFVYAIGFSLAYLQLSAGTGALILFALVQFTMIGVALAGGARFRTGEWAGVAVAAAGFVYLMLPGLSVPPLGGALLMAVAGIAWGLYSHWGRGAPNPVAGTARNFLLTLPAVVLLFAVPAGETPLTPLTMAGVTLALISGAVTSGLGYVIWYAALRGLSGMAAAILQLSVPVIAALSGAAFLGEAVTLRLALASALILGGIYVTIRAGRRKPAQPAPPAQAKS